MRLTIVGCGEAFDSGWGNHSSLFSGRGLPTVLFDCGYQIPERLWAMPEAYASIDAVYLTHLHADHCQGLIPLFSRYWEEKRSSPLAIYGPTGTESVITRSFDLGYPGLRQKLPFEVRYHESRPEFAIGKLRLRTARSAHSVLNLAVRVTLPNGKSFALSGDGQLTDATRELFRGCDLLLHECFWLKPGPPGIHADLATLREYAETAGIARIGVTHLSRLERKKIEKALPRSKKWFSARPGQSLALE
jgi:ribonuclease BN (tRNA processing enzyme)